MVAIVKWDRSGKRGQSEPMAILDAGRIAADGRAGWGESSHWIEPVVGDDSAELLARARAEARSPAEVHVE